MARGAVWALVVVGAGIMVPVIQLGIPRPAAVAMVVPARMIRAMHDPDRTPGGGLPARRAA